MNMKRLIKTVCVGFVLGFGLVGCASEDSKVTSGGGSDFVSDSGTNSARHAGVYSGTLVLTFASDIIRTRNRSLDATLAVGSDGVARLIIDENATTGSINNDQFGFRVRVSDTEDLIECSGDALINGSISGNIAQAVVTGSGECQFLAFDDPMTISGSLSASR